MLETIFYSVIFGVAVYKIGNFFMNFLIAVRAHYWG
ncbi:Hypothetical protein W5S_2315 [Pectobacterium parmentieri]|uniref:Uncharacterized protein n=1 Tax=Pectobacterium parmentieri TaxID=1905730 RepID=A0A0H3I6H1_PECPM|nr:Hypothetical protein W5S_2315 [Pectobacterium parmentieri]